MPIMDHLGELRRRLTIIVVSLLTVAVIVYFATPTLIDLMIDQIKEAMRGGDLYVLTALGGFTIRFKVAMFFSMIICTPIIIWEIMAFILPALKPKERKWVVPTVAALVALFFIGMIFCYYVIQPAAFGWLLDQSFEFARTWPTPRTTSTSTCCLRLALASPSSCRW
jgi:sec-independent protein translocase protein TatC